MKTLAASIVFLLLSIMTFAQYQVGHTTFTFNDPTRTGGFGSGGGAGRQIQTEIYYPAALAGTDVALASGEFPVIVFGHGFSMLWSAYDNFWNHYVEQGYIMAFPRTEGGLSPNHGDFGLDIKIVDEKMMLFNDDPTSLFFEGINGNSALMGHSMGGGASYLAAANNTSIKTLVSFAGAETTPSAIAAAADVTVPTVVFYGSKDGVTPPAEHAIPMYNALGAGCKSLVNIVDGNHCRFANSNGACETAELFVSPGGAISRANHHARLFSVLDLWLAYTLKNDCSAYQAYLDILTDNTSIIDGQTTCAPLETPSIVVDEFLLTSSLSGTNYQWYLNGEAISGADQISHTAEVSGDYSVEVFFPNGCSAISTEVAIDVCVDLAQPVVTEDSDVLICSIDNASYQWFLNGSQINGATDQTYTPTVTGNYYVQVTYDNACQSTSADFYFEVVSNPASIGEKELETIQIFPNPTNSVINIVVNDHAAYSGFELYDVTGQLIMSGSQLQKSIDLTNYPNGLYFVRIADVTRKVIKK